MVRHTNDNDKKPRPRQAGRDGDRPLKGKDGPRSGGDRPFKDKPGFKADGPRGDGPRKGPGGKPGGKPGERADAPAAPLRQERIAKVMARAGYASRREVERLIGLGRVAVNGKILDTAATLVTREDAITVDKKPIGNAEATRVWRYHKPVGLLVSHNDPAGRPTVFDALPSFLPRVISVGRLDINSEGLLLLTNDGELSRALELPTTGWVRQYRVRARGRATQAELDKLKDGAFVDGVRYGPIEATLDKAKEGEGGANLWLSVSITEGKNREVRKVLESIGLTVNRLIRLAYGPFQLGTLAQGQVEEVGPRVIRELLADKIAPENLPTGDTVATPPPTPGRRTSRPIVRGKSGSALSDPSRKPSRTRAAEAAVTDGEARQQKKDGWAKAKPKFEHAKTFKPRARPEGATAQGDGERPKRPFRPREDQFIDKPRGPRTGPGAARSDKPPRAPRAGPGAARPDGEGGSARDNGPPWRGKPGAAPRGRSSDGPKGPPRGGKPGGRSGGKPGGFSGGPSGARPRGPKRDG